MEKTLKDKHSWGVVAVFAAFFIMLLASNQNDWDHFLSFFEVELRSWLVDRAPPFWSYQLCAGVTRIGDPQSFGLSPLFLPVLLLGSFWGAKVLVLCCVWLGYVHLAKILSFVGARDSISVDGRSQVSSALSLFFVFGNYFLWHFHVGHLTFALILLAFVPAYYLIASVVSGPSLDRSLGVLLSVFAYCTAGFYHSLVFFLLPLLGLAPLCLLFFASQLPKLTRKDLWKRAIASLGVLALAVLLSSYKWRAVLEYQRLFPRTLAAHSEENPLGHILVSFLLPTFKYRYLGWLEDSGPWAIYEFSSFSLIPWILISVLFASLVRRLRLGGKSRFSLKETSAWAIAFLIGLLLCLGDSSPVPLFSWVNHAFFQNSLRVVGRFHIVVLFLSTLLLARYLAVHDCARTLFKKVFLPLGVVLTFLNILTFFPHLDHEKLITLLRTQKAVIEEMNFLVPAKARVVDVPGNSFMFSLVSAGAIVPNCYQPLGRTMNIGHERWRSPVIPAPLGGKVDLLAPGAKGISDECRSSAFVTQNEVHFDPGQCPEDLCFHLNMLNLHRPPPLVWNPERMLYCVK